MVAFLTRPEEVHVQYCGPLEHLFPQIKTLYFKQSRQSEILYLHTIVRLGLVEQRVGYDIPWATL